ncbi:MAG: hypothetical protein WB771_13910 [Solirubrobacterales bacterium]
MKRLLLASVLLIVLALPAGAKALTLQGTPVTVNDAAPASPYPAAIPVFKTRGSVTGVTAELFGVRHQYPDDLDVLLAGPTGQSVVLLSDACANDIFLNVTIGFDDGAARMAPMGPQSCEASVYKPTDYHPGDPFPPPAPQGKPGNALSVFDGTNPVGTWGLYVVDDSPPGSGSIHSWSLTLRGVKSRLKCAGRPATIVGTPGRNVIRGTNKADVIVGLGGNDKIFGIDGNDRICGGKGRDKLIGGHGRDILLGGPGNDKLKGGGGNDKLIGGKGKDKLIGGNGHDQEKQ